MLQVEVTRGQVVESTHLVRACAATVDGDPVGEASPGDADWSTFLRSSAKPFQAAPAAAAGVIERLGLEQRHLAIGCASHDGSATPTALVREVLAAAGLDEFAVHTGDDGQGGLVKHQCSGNHALVLAWCVVEGWPTDTYLHREHPAQVAMQQAVATACGVEPHLEPDNCGMTAHRVPLRAMATAYARLGIGWSGVPGLDVVAAAMRANPYVVREAGQADSELMAASPALVAKVGAEAALGIGSSEGVGVALRIVDGGYRAWGPAAVAAARRWLDPSLDGPALDALAEVVVRDGASRPIGVLRAAWS
ncbi:MAG: asparaginase [Acidimicrobiales bacterium]